jgi:type I restriction enzyme S subunit
MSDTLPKGWKKVKLGKVAEIVKDIVNPNEFDDLNYIGLEHIGQENLRIISIGKSREVNSAKYLFKPNDILFGKLRPYFRKVVKPKFNGVCSTDIWVFRAKQGYDQNYLYYFLANWDFVNIASSGECGTRMPRADWNFLQQTEWIFPPLPEQKVIAGVLSSLDDKIDLLHRQNKTLEEMAMTLFRQWFIEPTKDGLPKGWKEVSLGEFIKEILSGDWGKDKPEGEYKIKVNCIRGTDISDLQNSLPKKTPIRFIKQSKFKSIEPKDGDIIIEISGGTETQSTGRAIYISSFNRQLFEYPIVFSNFCRLLRPKENYYTYYLYLYLKYLYINDEFFSLENGTSGIKNLDYKTLLYDLKYPMPKNTEIYLSFYENVSIIFEKIDKNKIKIQTLEKLRDTLLPKLMSGEVKVKF